MKVDVCDMCKKPLEDEYYHIPVLRASLKNPGWGKMVLRIGGKTLCKSCAFGIAGVVNGDEEVKYAKKYATNIDWDAIGRLYDQGKTVKEIVVELGYSATTVRRGIAKKKAASGNEEK